MPLWLQHSLVLLLVGLCLAWTLFQSARTLFGKRSRLGKCCSRGCDTKPTETKPTESKPRTTYIPLSSLKKH
jgi:hypothetical protein